MKEKIVVSLILFLAIAVWAPTLSTYFSQDDWVFLSHVYKQPFLSVWKHYPEAFYRPMGQQLFFFLGSRLFGIAPQGFHLIGLVIHLLNIWLLRKLLNIWDYSSTRTPRGWLRGMRGLGNGAFGAGFRPDRLEDTPQPAAGRPHDRSLKYFLLIFYAVNPAHFVALNWLTQTDIEIVVTFSLLTILFWKRAIFSFVFFLGALLSHETAVMLPIAMAIWRFKGPTLPRQSRTLLKLAIFFCFGILVLIIKYLANPFSSQGDYSVLLRPMEIFSTIRWYALRALAIPEGIRSLPVWLIILSLIPGLILILMFRQKLVRGLGIYLIGVMPVLGFGNHLLSAYAIFGITLMMIELGRINVIPAKAGIYLNRFPPSLTVRLQELFVHGSRSAIRRAGKSGMTMFLATAIVWLAAAGFVYFNYLNHWSTERGIISRQLTQEYIRADSNEKNEILTRSKDYVNNPEIYFSAMAEKQFKVLDRGVGRGLFDVLFYRGNDMTTQFLPDAEFFRDRILAWKFPMWNPWIMAGMPYFLDPQNLLWYPPNYIFLLTPVETGFLILLVGHLGLAGWGVKRVLGEFGVFGKLALLGVALYILSPKLTGHIEEGNWTLVIAACWLPALYYGLKTRKFWWTAISLSAIIINNLNIGYYAIIFVSLFYLFQKRPGLAAARPGLKMLKIFIVTAVLTIPRWLPLVIFGGQTVRADLHEPPLPLWSWTKILKSLFFPLAGEHPVLQNEEILYLGILPLVVGAVLFFWKGLSLRTQGESLKDAKELRFWFAWLTFIFFVALNNKTPLFYLINKLPGFSLFRITTRPWIFAGMAMALAAPIVISRIGDIRQIRGIRLEQKIAKIAIAVLSGLILMEFIWFDWRIFVRREIGIDLVPARFYRQMAAEGVPAFAELQRGKLVRAYCTTGCLDRLTAQRMGIALLGGNNPIQLKSFVEYLQAAGGYKEQGYYPILPPYTVFNQQPQPNAELLAKTATKFVVSPYQLEDNNLELLDQEGEFRLYKNTVGLLGLNDHYFEIH